MHQIKYVKDAYSKSGTSLTDTTLEAVLMHCLSLPSNGKKGKYGSIFVYNSTQVGIHDENELSTGIILIDIDYIDKKTARTIYENFDKLYSMWPALIAIQYSSSFYIHPTKAGLHIYVKSDNINYYEYKQQSQICLAIFAQLVYKYIKIDLQTNKNTLDFHNTSLYQRFNLFYSSFKFNDFAVKFNMNDIDFNDLEQLVIKYKLSLDTTITKTISPIMNNVVQNSEYRQKIKIDRNLHIGIYSGNDIRFRISIIADKLFGDNAKSFCDKYFYYENNKSIYTHYPSGNTTNQLIYKWLVNNGYIIENSQDFIENWLDEYTAKIIERINKERQFELVAPTGSGKTTFVNNTLAHHFNSIVIVPFNVTNKLYDNLFEVNASYTGDVPKNKPVVMVWDQAIRRWDEIKDRHIIIDEAHTLFFDRNYRDSAIQLILKLRETNAWCTFITATPAGESKIFNMSKMILYKKRSEIQLNIKAVDNIEWAQYNYIRKALDNNWYDRIVLLDDLSAKKIYEQFIVNFYGDDISYIRSSTKETEDFIDLRDSEILKKRLTICTCVAFNGLNFKNENENILVVGSIQQGITTSCEIIQQIGRIRNSNVTGLYFYNPEKYYYDDIDTKEQKAQEFNSIYVSGCNKEFLSFDRKYLDKDYTNALKEIQEYQTNHSNMDSIINELGMCGYIKGYVEEKAKKSSNNIKMSLAIKRNESNEMKNDILSNEFDDKEYKSEYQKKWAQDIRYLITNPSYSGISMHTFIELFNKGTKNKLIETTINNIKEIIRYVSISDSDFDNVIKKKNVFMNMLSNEVDRKKFSSNIKHISDIRKKYKNKIKVSENGFVCFDDIFQDVIRQEEERQIQIKKGNIKGGKKSKQVKDINTGKIYNSKAECAKDINKSQAYITKYKDRFIVL